MEQRFDTPRPVRVDVRVPSGDATVEAVDTTETEVLLAGPAELLDRSTVELRGDELRIEVPRRKGLFLTFAEEPVRVRVRCPRESSLHWTTKSGDLETRGPLAAVRAQGASGDVVVEDADDVVVQTASGDVTVGRAGGVEVHAVSGDVLVRSADGRVTARSVSGDVRLESVAAGEVKVEAVSGDVRVGIRRGSLVRVDATTISGDTRSELDLDDDAPADAGDGPAVDLRVKTVSGDISVVRAAAATPQEV